MASEAALTLDGSDVLTLSDETEYQDAQWSFADTTEEGGGESQILSRHSKKQRVGSIVQGDTAGKLDPLHSDTGTSSPPRETGTILLLDLLQGVRGGPNQKLHEQMDLCWWQLEFRLLHGQEPENGKGAGKHTEDTDGRGGGDIQVLKPSLPVPVNPFMKIRMIAPSLIPAQQRRYGNTGKIFGFPLSRAVRREFDQSRNIQSR
ncbi:uncharacterized protein PADG_02572 [Paracoccidioides brasiliensis Pb18]|uniref:Uncharacterized protein n=1 Tax=Paracoccidioides brasiliensis (strain Pb18) TaxID=502780 RepID=C1G5W7_PARBD|nr:uncharacterized protein PADG_02572 [Paracoccidioides brasiliensis Pb18]EEH46474.2 hypothetical protein PADG_02572 [Paracoccidioides brasiliensis Pb18]